MTSRTRRDFLRVAATASCGLASRLTGASVWASSAAGTVRAWCTSKDRKYEETAAPVWRAADNSPQSIRIDASKQYQQLLGFGAALTDSSCYLYSQLNAKQKQALFSELYGPAGLRLSVSRTCIGASDYSTMPYSYDDSTEPDPELKKFNLDHDKSYILPTLRDARQSNPELFLFSTPWSPPGWMKAGGSLLGGSMRKKYFAPYADYFVKFLQGYSAEGVKINAVTIQNEVDTDQDSRMPAALWGQEYEVEFIKKFLGPALERASLDTKIWILDHNYNLAGRAVDELSDPVLNKYVDGVAWHGYLGNPDAMTRVHDAFPAKNCYFTEGGPDITSPDYATDWTKWSQSMTAILRNWAECIVGWNVLLDEKGRPNIGPFPCGGLVTLNSQTQEITRSGQYWAMAHYSKAIRRGAHVVASEGNVNNIDHVACQNPDGSFVLVLTNRGEKQTVRCQLGAKAMDVALDPESVTTLVW
jgi:glucosylceramidase